MGMTAGTTTPPMRARTRLSAEDRRAQILSVAGEAFRHRPYADVSLDEIAESAGIARGLISHHFGTKRDLYLEVARSIVQVPQFPVPDFINGQTVRERLEISVSEWLEAVERDQTIWADTLRVGMGDPELAELAEQAREQTTIQAVRVMGLGPVEDLSPQRLGLMRCWEALAEGAVLQWLTYQRLTRDQVRGLIVESGVRLAEGLFDEFAEMIGVPPASPS